MAKYCSDDCKAVCDFCKSCEDYMTDGEFEGTGTCVKKDIEVDASSYCGDDFECFGVEK